MNGWRIGGLVNILFFKSLLDFLPTYIHTLTNVYTNFIGQNVGFIREAKIVPLRCYPKSIPTFKFSPLSLTLTDLSGNMGFLGGFKRSCL